MKNKEAKVKPAKMSKAEKKEAIANEKKAKQSEKTAKKARKKVKKERKAESERILTDKQRIIRKGIRALIVVLVIVGAFIGFDKVFGDAEDLPLVPALSSQELMDYYKESMSYKTIATRNIKQPTELEFKESDKETVKRVTKAFNAVQAQFNSGVYQDTFLMTRGQHDAMKYAIDDKVLTFKKVTEVKEAIGYYFLTAEYTVKANGVGSCTGLVNYMGIHGGLNGRANGYATVNEYYMAKATPLVTKYYADEATNTAKSITIPSSEKKAVVKASKGAQPRTAGVDITVYNSVGGAAVANTAFMPELTYIYNPVVESGSLSGYGIYPEGAFGMVDFGYSRNKLSGTMHITYIFKKDLLDPEKMTFETCYIKDYENAGLKDIKSKEVAAEFVTSEIEQIVERADRVINNQSMAGLFSRDIFKDLGMGTLYGFYGNNTNIYSFMTNVDNVIKSDGNRYLVELSRTVQDSAIGNCDTGTYKEKYYAVVEQDGTKFVINDWVLRSKEVIKEPQPVAENTELKRLAALNLRGEISDKEKVDITKLTEDLYSACNERSLEGMYKCFDNDTSLLTAKKKEYLNSQLRGWLTAYGADTKSRINGQITEWIGGAEHQAEFMAEEMVEYAGEPDALYINAYYLVSNYGGNWVIDDYKVISSKEVEGAELKEIQARVLN